MFTAVLERPPQDPRISSRIVRMDLGCILGMQQLCLESKIFDVIFELLPPA